MSSAFISPTDENLSRLVGVYVADTASPLRGWIYQLITVGGEPYARITADLTYSKTFDVPVKNLVLAQPPKPEPDVLEVEEAIVAEIRKRRDAGRAKYGTTMERTDLTTLQWVQHAKEELLDAAIYLEKLKRTLQEKGIS